MEVFSTCFHTPTEKRPGQFQTKLPPHPINLFSHILRIKSYEIEIHPFKEKGVENNGFGGQTYDECCR